MIAFESWLHLLTHQPLPDEHTVPQRTHLVETVPSRVSFASVHWPFFLVTDVDCFKRMVLAYVVLVSAFLWPS